jgi:AcrR family transcriptional regulator
MAKPSLSQERILNKARALMKRDGVNAVTLRGLAEALGVTPMAIYRYFDSKEALLAELFNRFVNNAQVLPERPLPWDRWLRHVGLAMWSAMIAEPDWLRLLGSSQVRADSLKVIVGGLEVLEEAGFPTDEALAAYFAVIYLVIGAACLNQPMDRIDPEQPFEALDPALLGRLFGSIRSIEELRAASRIETSLDLLIDSLRLRLAALAQAGSTARGSSTRVRRKTPAS